MKKLFLLVTFLPSLNKSAARPDSLLAKQFFRNAVKITHGDFYIQETIRVRSAVWKLYQAGIYYERNVYRNWHVGFGYMQWLIPTYEGLNNAVAHIDSYRDPRVGMLGTRYNYKMADLYIGYNFHFGTSNHHVNVSLGASYIWGENSYIDHVLVNNAAIPDRQVISKTVKKTYTSVLPGLSYEYSFLQNRFAAGINVGARYYRPVTTQYDYGVHVKFNF